jgi:hypothetical protein
MFMENREHLQHQGLMLRHIKNLHALQKLDKKQKKHPLGVLYRLFGNAPSGYETYILAYSSATIYGLASWRKFILAFMSFILLACFDMYFVVHQLSVIRDQLGACPRTSILKYSSWR